MPVPEAIDHLFNHLKEEWEEAAIEIITLRMKMVSRVVGGGGGGWRLSEWVG